MSHPEPDMLLQASTGGSDEETRRHVATCPQCQADTATPQATRTSSLQPLGDHVTSGTLALSGPRSRESLSVQLHDADPGDGFLQVWLLDAKTGGMVALGVLDGDRGSYAVPSGLDL